MADKRVKKSTKITSEKPVSLFPLSLEEALEALLRTKPPKEKKKKKPKENKGQKP